MTNNVITLFDANGQPINNQQVEAPKIIHAMDAEYAHSQVSNKYQQVKTIEVVKALESKGWEVTKYSEARVKDATRRGFQKHYVWMRPQGINNQIEVGDTEMRVILTNSHDGSSAFTMQGGLFRLVCSNGLVVSAGDIERISLRHTLEEIEEVAIDSAFRIAAMAPKINEVINKMREVELNPFTQLSFAKDAIAIAWDKKPDFVNPSEMLQQRRSADKGDNVWAVYNRVQENLIRGGLSTATNRRTRAINSPVRDIEINRELFTLATKYAA
jgi:hypothetical protein